MRFLNILILYLNLLMPGTLKSCVVNKSSGNFMSEYIYLLQVHGYKLKPSGEEKFKEDFVISDFAFTTQEAAEGFMPEWKEILMQEQGFIEQGGFQLQIQTKQVRLI